MNVLLWMEYFERYHEDRINKLALSYPHEKVLEVDVLNDGLAVFSQMRLLKQLLNNPLEAIRQAQEAISRVNHIFTGKKLENVEVRFKNLPTIARVPLNRISVEHLGKFVAVEGVVKRVGIIQSEIRRAYYVCENCGNHLVVLPEDGKVPKVSICNNCGSRSISRSKELDVKINFQHIIIQEFPEGIDKQPVDLHVYLKGSLVGSVLPGDKVRINGIVRDDVPSNKVRGQFYIEANSIEFLENDIRDLSVSRRDVGIIKALASDPNIYNKLIDSIAPNVYGHEVVKLAIALQLFGGISKRLPDGTRLRGDIHVLLIGDPSTAKSQILRSVYNIAPRAVFNTGTRVSGVGLTAAAVKDEIDGKWTLEAGTLVLADGGIALIDELEKASRDDRNALLEPLEQQTVTISKAGINATLNARCAVLAAANPKFGRFDRYAPIVEQINIEPMLLSRFDLIFVLLDEPGEKDAEIADAVFRAHTSPKMVAIDSELLRKYIHYARENVKSVKWDDKAWNIIKDYYIRLREHGKDTDTIPITVRQLEAMIRLAEASAKVQLRNYVTIEDAQRAVDLMDASLVSFALDPSTGEIDIDLALSGVSTKQRKTIMVIKEIIEDLEESYDRGVPEEEIIKEAENRGITRNEVSEALSKLKQSGEVYSPKPGRYKIWR